jgi:hypothetical protein
MAGERRGKQRQTVDMPNMMTMVCERSKSPIRVINPEKQVVDSGDIIRPRETVT